MDLVLDIGNSAAKAGLLEGGGVHHTFRLTLPHDAPAGAWRAALREGLAGEGLSGCTPTRAGCCSVVPAATPQAAAALGELAGREPLLVGPELQLPFALTYTTPATLGTDRLAAAAAAWHRYGTPHGDAARSVVALDAGTAVTYDVIDRTGAFRGGPIGPGPGLLRRALHTGTAQLPEVPLTLPERAIGRSTQEALQSGVMFGFVDAVGGMLRRIAAELGETPYVVATGGWSALLARELPILDATDPHLVLRGIQVLMDLNPS